MKLFDLVYDTLLNQYGVVLGDIENFDGEKLEIFKIRNSCNSPYVLYLKDNYFKVVKMQHFDYVNCMFKDKAQYFIWKYFYNYLLNLALNESVNENEFDYSMFIELLNKVDKKNKDLFTRYLMSISVKNPIISVKDMKPNKLYLLYNLSESSLKLLPYYGKAKCEISDNSFKIFTSEQVKEYISLLRELPNNDILTDFEVVDKFFNDIPISESKKFNQRLFTLIEDLDVFNPLFYDFSLNNLSKNNNIQFTYSTMLLQITNNLRVFELCDLPKLKNCELPAYRVKIVNKPLVYYPIVKDLKLFFDFNK